MLFGYSYICKKKIKIHRYNFSHVFEVKILMKFVKIAKNTNYFVVKNTQQFLYLYFENLIENSSKVI